MIYGIGTDIIEPERMRKAIERNEAFKRRVFATDEQAYCDGNAIAYQHYAARFAAKEAFLKAFGTGLREGLELDEIAVVVDELGKPSIELRGATKQTCDEAGIGEIHLSLSHIKETAVAFVVIEKL
mgnify:CR=1 FL=1